MSDIIKDLEGKSLEELKQMGRDEERRLDQLEGAGKKDFSFVAGVETKVMGPITDEDVAKIVKEADEIIAKGHIVYLRARQHAVAEAAQKKIDAAKTRIDDIALYGLQKEVQPRGRDSVRTESRSQSRRQMFRAAEPCVDCGKEDYEVPFEPTPGKPLRCPSCHQKMLANQDRGGSRRTAASESSDKTLQEENNRLKTRVAELEATAGHGGEKMPSGLSKKKQKEWRSQHRGESEEQE